MGLQRFERGLERLVEGTVAKVFRSGLQPVELGRRLAREMDLRRTVGMNGVFAPNHFEILLSSEDNSRFEPIIENLRRELIETAREHARNERYSFVGPVGVDLGVDESLTPGIFLLNGEMHETAGGGPVGSLVLADGKRIELGEAAVVVGRLPECDIALPDPNVSRRHIEVKRNGADFILKDLDSTNGTKVNGAWVRGGRKLNDGDQIELGATAIRFDRS